MGFGVLLWSGRKSLLGRETCGVSSAPWLSLLRVGHVCVLLRLRSILIKKLESSLFHVWKRSTTYGSDRGVRKSECFYIKESKSGNTLLNPRVRWWCGAGAVRPQCPAPQPCEGTRCFIDNFNVGDFLLSPRPQMPPSAVGLVGSSHGWDPCGWDAGSDLLQQAPAFTPKITCAKTQGLISLLLPLQMEAQL